MARLIADRACELEAIHAGHADIEQQQCEVLLREDRECVGPRAGGHDRAAERLERGFVGDQVGGLIVDHEDVLASSDPEDLLGGEHVDTITSRIQRQSQTSPEQHDSPRQLAVMCRCYNALTSVCRCRTIGFSIAAAERLRTACAHAHPVCLAAEIKRSMARRASSLPVPSG